MRLLVFPTAILLTHGISVLGGPLSVRKEIRDLAQGLDWIGSNTPTFLEALKIQPDTPMPGSPSDAGSPVTEIPPSVYTLSDAVDNIYAALGGASSPGAGQPDTQAFPEFQSRVPTIPTSPTNLDGSYDGAAWFHLPALASGSNFDGTYLPLPAPAPSGNNSPGVGSSIQAPTRLPESLAGDVNGLVNGEWTICHYGLFVDKKGLGRSDCMDKPQGWSSFQTEYVGFVLLNAGNKPIFSLMNVVHNNARRNERDINVYIRGALSRIDEEVLHGFKKDWEETVTSFMPKGWTLISEDGIKDEQTFKGICSKYSLAYDTPAYYSFCAL
ncbi:hypothetical protein MMC07_004797 [Pseudocyphellaria aurata]|nr:hypothetical protein [Pseudocyphellaria aurata]